MQNPYPEVSIIHYQDRQGVWQFMIVLKGKEEEKMLDLLLVGCSKPYVVFENCRYMGKVNV